MVLVLGAKVVLVVLVLVSQMVLVTRVTTVSNENRVAAQSDRSKSDVENEASFVDSCSNYHVVSWMFSSAISGSNLFTPYTNSTDTGSNRLSLLFLSLKGNLKLTVIQEDIP